jgi:hypothetical protein
MREAEKKSASSCDDLALDRDPVILMGLDDDGPALTEWND